MSISIDEFRRRLKSFPSVARQASDNFISANAATIEQLNVTQMYDTGIGSNNQLLGPYAPSTIKYKNTEAGALGRDTRTDHVTLRDTGEFHKSINLKLTGKGFNISSDDEKADKLEDTYGEVVGLTPQNLIPITNGISAAIKVALVQFLR